MAIVDDIKAPIEEELVKFETHFRQSMKANNPLLDRVTSYVIKRKGKQVRPMFVFLVAKMLGEVKDDTYTAASLIELLHTATLVHDDVVDDANERRGFFSVNALWKNKIAVLVGDFLLSKVLLLSIEQKQIRSLEVVARAVREMSEGELLQIEKARRLDIDEDTYFEVIRQKTASLIATCCEAGAISVQREDKADLMREFGEKIGLAFQIKDDIFDYGVSGNVGKPTGNDIREQKMTLPLIYTLNKVDKKTRAELINIVKRHHENPEKVRRAIHIVIENGGIEYAHKAMMKLKDEALSLLKEIPDSQSKKSLELLVEYTVNREK
ncbi:MAG: polyprenyl synthetase family protein [Brumimicrobium sp.]